MLVACSACSKRFDAAGYRDLHCPDCGALAKPTFACPMCGGAMHRRLSNTGAGVIIDVCRMHGTFFDATKSATPWTSRSAWPGSL